MHEKAIVLIWNDADDVYDYVQYITNLLETDVNMPFSRNINLPVFHYYGNAATVPSDEFIGLESENTIVFTFISDMVVLYNNTWKTYLDNLKDKYGSRCIFIGVCKEALNASHYINNSNFIRMYEYINFSAVRLAISVLHEVYRSMFNDNKAIKLFISHTKVDECGLGLAKNIRRIICEDTVMSKFFDQNDIIPGYDFEEEIKTKISNSSVISINTNHYHGRYWCQREIQFAKEKDLPIIEIDLLTGTVDRKFPISGNIPVLSVSKSDINKTEVLLDILEKILVESIRIRHVKMQLSNIDCENKLVLCRPPESNELNRMLDKCVCGTYGPKYCKVIYPDPEINSKEGEIFNSLGVDICTPITLYKSKLTGKKVGISISKVDIHESMQLGRYSYHLNMFAGYIAKYVLNAEAALIYGGDFRRNGFTDLLCEEARIVNNLIQEHKTRLIDYVAWPIYNNDKKAINKWIIENKDVAEIKKIYPNMLLNKDVPVNEFFKPDTVEKSYLWSLSLSNMRTVMIDNCDARICAGGKKAGYSGSIPGVLEEIVIALNKEKPLYLVGGFGGIVRDVCTLRLSSGEKIPETLTYEWQSKNNDGYEEKIKYYRDHEMVIDYDNMIESILKSDLNNGLSEEDNERLMTTVFYTEAVELILKGLSNVLGGK